MDFSIIFLVQIIVTSLFCCLAAIFDVKTGNYAGACVWS